MCNTVLFSDDKNTDRDIRSRRDVTFLVDIARAIAATAMPKVPDSIAESMISGSTLITDPCSSDSDIGVI